jgi:branched-chain amino acid transport system ATP-binding protein
LILLDEPAAGTNPAEKRELASLIKSINTDDGVGVLLIEHDMKLVMSVADRIVVLNFGQKIAEGTPEHIQRDPVVVAAYLGTSADTAAAEVENQPELHLIDVDPADSGVDGGINVDGVDGGINVDGVDEGGVA